MARYFGTVYFDCLADSLLQNDLFSFEQKELHQTDIVLGDDTIDYRLIFVDTAHERAPDFAGVNNVEWIELWGSGNNNLTLNEEMVLSANHPGYRTRSPSKGIRATT